LKRAKEEGMIRGPPREEEGRKVLEKEEAWGNIVLTKEESLSTSKRGRGFRKKRTWTNSERPNGGEEGKLG